MVVMRQKSGTVVQEANFMPASSYLSLFAEFFLLLEWKVVVTEHIQETIFFPVTMKLISFFTVISFHVVYT